MSILRSTGGGASGGAVIDDTTATSTSVYSSSKTVQLVNSKVANLSISYAQLPTSSIDTAPSTLTVGSTQSIRDWTETTIATAIENSSAGLEVMNNVEIILLVNQVVTAYDQVAQTLTLNIAGGTALNGYVPAVGERVLFGGQTEGRQNGIYDRLANVGGEYQFVRSSDSNAGKLAGGMWAYVVDGTLNSQQAYVLAGNGIKTINNPTLSANDVLVYVRWSGLSPAEVSGIVATDVAGGTLPAAFTTLATSGLVDISPSPAGLHIDSDLGTNNSVLMTSESNISLDCTGAGTRFVSLKHGGVSILEAHDTGIEVSVISKLDGTGVNLEGVIFEEGSGVVNIDTTNESFNYDIIGHAASKSYTMRHSNGISFEVYDDRVEVPVNSWLETNQILRRTNVNDGVLIEGVTIGDGLLNGININQLSTFPKMPVRLATQAALPASTFDHNYRPGGGVTPIFSRITGDANGRLSVDGQTVDDNSGNSNDADRLLIKNQVDAKENGLYQVVEQGGASLQFILQRTADLNGDPAAECQTGVCVLVQEETSGGLSYKISNGSGILTINASTLGGDDVITWSEVATVLLSNNSASVAPAVTDDTTAGYSAGSHWIDTTADQAYLCMDASVGAAVWKVATTDGSLYVDLTYVQSVGGVKTFSAASAFDLGLSMPAGQNVIVGAVDVYRAIGRGHG